MPEPRPDMLPEPENSQDESTKKPEVSEDPKTPEKSVEPDKSEPEQPKVKEEPPKEASTAPEGFVHRRERDKWKKKAKAAEAKLENQDNSSVLTDEEPAEIPQSYQQEIRELKLDKLVNKHPELEGRRDELDEYVEENPSQSLEDSVDLFRVRNDLVGQTQVEEPTGLETPTAGPKAPTASKYSAQDIEEMRQNDYKKYHELNMQGAFDDTEL